MTDAATAPPVPAADPLAGVLPNYAAWLSLDQAAARCGVPVGHVRNWVVTGTKLSVGRLHLKATKLGGKWRVDPADLVAFFDAVTRDCLPPSARTARPGPDEPAPETPAQRRRRGEAVMQRLRDKGMLPPLPT